MRQKYLDLDDLWCEWGEVTSAIMNHVKANEPLESNQDWMFEEGCVIDQHREDYSVYIAYRAYDPAVKSIVRLHVQAFVSNGDKITVKTNRREKVEQ